MRRSFFAPALFGILFIVAPFGCAESTPAARPASSEATKTPAAPPACTGRGETLLYATPGCGADVMPQCKVIPPPCAGYVCGCDGKTKMTFCGGVSDTKFASAGMCPGDHP